MTMSCEILHIMGRETGPLERKTSRNIQPWSEVAQQAWKATGYLSINKLAVQAGMSRSTLRRLLDGKPSADTSIAKALLVAAYGADATELIEAGLDSHQRARKGQPDNRKVAHRTLQKSDAQELRASHLGPFLKRSGVVADARVVVEIGTSQYAVTDAVYDRNTNTFVLYPHWMHREELR